ncbi:MAG: hypothetical protein NTV21_14855 [Planctomycetota bacterium]|nr:hypothetical protein [Planctomycetota bacterium]
MSNSRARWTALGLVAVAAIGLSVLWLRWSERPEDGGAAEREQVEEPAGPSAEFPRPPSISEELKSDEPTAETARVELPRDPNTVGPRKTHAKVELICALAGTEVDPKEVRIQVLADSDARVIDERAPDAVFATLGPQSYRVADVTPLLIGVGRQPTKLRVVAQAPRCVAFTDVAPNLSAADLASPSLIRLSAKVKFDCPWFVRGRIVAPCPPAEVRVFTSSMSGLAWGYPSPVLDWKPDEQGRFELPMQRTGRTLLTFRSDRSQTTRREFEINGRDDVELGDVELERGAAVSGQLLAAGRPLANADVALVPDESLSIAASLEGARDFWEGYLSGHSILRRALSDLGLIATSGGTDAPIRIVHTDSDGRFECGSLRVGKHWMVVLSASGQSTWIAPASFSAPAQDFVHEFDATRVEFSFGDAQGQPGIRRVTYSLDVRMPDDERVRLATEATGFGVVNALVQPGSLLELHACDQDVLIPVGYSTEPIVKFVSPCTKGSGNGK